MEERIALLQSLSDEEIEIKLQNLEELQQLCFDMRSKLVDYAYHIVTKNNDPLDKMDKLIHDVLLIIGNELRVISSMGLRDYHTEKFKRR